MRIILLEIVSFLESITIISNVKWLCLEQFNHYWERAVKEKLVEVWEKLKNKKLNYIVNWYSNFSFRYRFRKSVHANFWKVRSSPIRSTQKMLPLCLGRSTQKMLPLCLGRTSVIISPTLLWKWANIYHWDV